MAFTETPILKKAPEAPPEQELTVEALVGATAYAFDQVQEQIGLIGMTLQEVVTQLLAQGLLADNEAPESDSAEPVQ